jgi:alpha-galactosidase/6-phospho-beta-glucosidase family protein
MQFVLYKHQRQFVAAETNNEMKNTENTACSRRYFQLKNVWKTGICVYPERKREREREREREGEREREREREKERKRETERESTLKYDRNAPCTIIVSMYILKTHIVVVVVRRSIFNVTPNYIVKEISLSL